MVTENETVIVFAKDDVTRVAEGARERDKKGR